MLEEALTRVMAEIPALLGLQLLNSQRIMPLSGIHSVTEQAASATTNKGW